MDIRLASLDDAKDIRNIYSYYVTNTAVSFETEVPTVEEFKERISNTLKKYPYFVALIDNKIVGYAYASNFHSRKAYEHDSELSIYIDKDYRKQGIGKELLNKIEETLIKQNVYGLHSCIASIDIEDEYLTKDSEKFHNKMNFKLVGKHEKCGCKFNRWYNIIWMDKELTLRQENGEDFIPFSKLS